MCWNINIAASNPEQTRLRRALSREDLFTVAVDLFKTDTTEVADVVLPAASFLECDDIVASYFNLSLSAQVKAAEPMGESLPNSEIFRRLPIAIGMRDAELHEPDAEVIAHLLRRTGLGLDFAELARRGTVWAHPRPRIQFEALCFPTPSGRIELASDRAHGRRTPPGRPAAGRRATDRGAAAAADPRLGLDAQPQFRQRPKIAQRVGVATVALHPLDAAERALGQGDRAVLRSGTGELELSVLLSQSLPRGVAFSPKGRWPGLEAQGANVNLLNPGIPSDMGASTTVHGIEVSIAPAA